MENKENKFNENKYHSQNDIIKFKFIKSKTNTVTKFDISRNSFLKNKNKTSSNFNLYRNLVISKNFSKDISNKKDELIKSDINSNRKTVLVNSVQFDINFLRRMTCINNRREIITYQAYDTKNYASNIRWLNFAQYKKGKIDLIKYKFLSGQKFYNKKLFDQVDFGFSSYYSEKMNKSLKKNLKKYYINLEQLKKQYFENEDKKINSTKNINENFCLSSLKNFINAQNKKNNYTIIKIKKIRLPNITKQSNNFLSDYTNSIKSRKNYFEDEDHKENNKSKENKKIIDDVYNEYLKGISSSESDQSKSETNIVSEKNHKIVIKKIKPLNDKFHKGLMAQSLKQQIQNNYFSNMMFKNYKNLFKFKRIISNRKKFLDDISKSIAIENHALRKKIMLEYRV